MSDLGFQSIRVIGIEVSALPDKLYGNEPKVYLLDKYTNIGKLLPFLESDDEDSPHDNRLLERLDVATEREEKVLIVKALTAERERRWLPPAAKEALDAGTPEVEGSLTYYYPSEGCFDEARSWKEPGVYRRVGKINDGPTVYAFFPERGRIIRPYLQHPDVQARLAQVAGLEGVVSTEQLEGLTKNIEIADHGKRFLQLATFDFQGKEPTLDLYLGSFIRWSLKTISTKKESQMWKAATITYEKVS